MNGGRLRNAKLEVQDVAEGLHLTEMVVKHQENTGKGEDQEQIKGDAAHTPSVGVAHSVAIDLGGMEMQENVGEHTESAIARSVVVLVTEDGSVELGLGGILQAFDLFFGFRGEVVFK